MSADDKNHEAKGEVLAAAWFSLLAPIAMVAFARFLPVVTRGEPLRPLDNLWYYYLAALVCVIGAGAAGWVVIKRRAQCSGWTVVVALLGLAASLFVGYVALWMAQIIGLAVRPS
jgi:cytochrome bd-type quinol oxidase subunit 2